MAERVQYVTLGVAEELFATPVEKVQEILEMRPIARLPKAPTAALLGMIDVRGKGVPVVDLRLLLDLSAAADTENTRIIVLTIPGQDGDLQLGLRADRVFEVTFLDDGALAPPPTVSGQWAERCIAGIGRRNGRFVTVLELERLLSGFQERAPLAA